MQQLIVSLPLFLRKQAFSLVFIICLNLFFLSNIKPDCLGIVFVLFFCLLFLQIASFFAFVFYQAPGSNSCFSGVARFNVHISMCILI